MGTLIDSSKITISPNTNSANEIKLTTNCTSDNWYYTLDPKYCLNWNTVTASTPWSKTITNKDYYKHLIDGISKEEAEGLTKKYPKEDYKINVMKTVPKVKSIKTIGKKTFVYWQDGTFTKVTCEKDQQPDPFAAYCIAFAKKIYGSTSAIIEDIEKHDEAILRQKQKEANRKRHEEQRKKEREAFDREVEKKRHELAVLRAAEKKLNGEA